MKKRLFSILTALCRCLSLLPTAALAEEEINTAAVKVISCSAWPENGKWYPDSSAESLFDGDSTTSWDWELNNNSSRVRFETSEPISLVSYTLSTGKTWNRSDFNPVSWTLNASNNGEDWVQIHSVTDGGLSTTPAQNKIFTVSPLIDKYSYYEFVFTVRSGGHITLGEIELVQSTCPHTDCEETVTPPTCTTGGSTYRECKACHATQTTNFTSALGHAFGEDGVCTRSGCTAERSDFQAVLKTASDLQYYTSVYEALNAAQEKTGCTVQMLSDAETNRITLSKGNFTLDLNGYTLKASSDLTFLISDHAHITLVNTDSSKLAKVLSNAYSPKAFEVTGTDAQLTIGTNTADSNIQFIAKSSAVDQSEVFGYGGEVLAGGTLTVYGGSFQGKNAGLWIHDNGIAQCSVNIYNGVFEATGTDGVGLLMENGGSAKLYGGEFHGITPSGNRLDLLTDRSALSTTDSEGDIFDLSNSENSLAGKIYAVLHTHDFRTSTSKCKCGLPCTHSNINTETGICSDCYQRAGSVKLTKGSTVTFYNSLPAAVSEAAKYENADSTVTLLTDFNDLGHDDQLTLGWHSDVTLDLNGKKVNMSGVLFHLAGADGKLTVVNTATTQAEVRVIGTFAFAQTGTSVTIGREGGSESNIAFYANQLARFAENAQNPYQMTLTIYGGEYHSGSFVLDIETAGAAVNIHGGNFADYATGAIYLKGGGKLHLSGGAFSQIRNSDCPYLDLLADGCAFADAGGNVVDATAYDFFNKSCKVVSGHTHQSRQDMDGKCACGYVCPHTNISATGHCDACGGDFPAELTTDGKTTHHETMEHALNAAASGSTIRLINTTMLGSENYTLADKAITIDLNGQNLTGGLVEDPTNTEATLQISGSGAVMFTGAGSVQPYIHLDKNLTADNQTAFLGGTFSSILQSSDNTTVLPTLAQANGFALRNADGSWLSLSGLAAEKLQNVTASAVPVAVVTMPEDASLVYGDKALPAGLTKLTIRAAKGFSASVMWKTGERLLSAKTWSNYGEYAYPELSYTGDPLDKGEYPLTCVITAVDKTGKTFTAYETVAPKLTVTAANAEIKTAPKAVPELTYDTTAHALVTPGAAEHGTLQYALSESGPYSADVPIATGAGTYEVWYKIVPDKNYAAPAAQFVEARIASATLTVTALDKQITAGQPAPDLANPIPGEDYKVDGLLGQDTLAAVTLTYNETPDTSRAGSYTINISATLANYDIMTIPGTLTIVPRRSAGGGSTTYPVNTPSKVANGTVTVSPKNASKGDTVTVTVKSDSGYVLETISVTDKNGNNLKLTDKGNGKYTFTMPTSKVEMKVTFMEDNSVLNFFYDVPNNAYYYEAVKWAAENGITGGVGNSLFAPNQPCTRAQIVTFLWRAAGSPEPKNMSNFSDVPADSYYAKAVAWAVENGITTGTGDGSKFSPDATCTRAQSVTFLFRASKASANGAPAFSDVAATAYYAEAVKWATDNGITNGIGDNLFGSDNDCTRAQIVTFLYRMYQEN